MPELPEVETVRRGLEPALAGVRLLRVTTRRADLRFPFPPRFAERLTSARVLALGRRGKFLLAPLDTQETLIAHLGMTGRFLVERKDLMAAPPKHAHVEFETDENRILFMDPRRFGFMDLCPSSSLSTHPRLIGLGREPLSRDFNGAFLASALRGRRQSVKAVLMDQTVTAGIGNIYACEALHRAHVEPSTPAGALSREAVDRLVTAIKLVLREAIGSGGSTLNDYATADGSPGYFQHRFRVYGREGEACLVAGCEGYILRTVQAGRSTFHCPACQG